MTPPERDSGLEKGKPMNPSEGVNEWNKYRLAVASGFYTDTNAEQAITRLLDNMQALEQQLREKGEENKRLKATLRVFDKHGSTFKVLAFDEMREKLNKAMRVVVAAKAVYDNIERDKELGNALEDFYKGDKNND